MNLGAMPHVWTCRCCGKQFSTLPLDYAFNSPYYWQPNPDNQSRSDHFLTSDACVIEGRDYFIRGCLELPVIGTSEKFIWGVWVSLSEASFRRAHELWKGPIPSEEPSRFGWLSNEIAAYPKTLNLKTNVYFREGNQRPRILLEPTDHPLAREQRDGISIERIEEIATLSMPRH